MNNLAEKSNSQKSAFHERRDVFQTNFPVDVFISDNRRSLIRIIPHWHDFVEILYVLEGRALQKVNDQCFEIRKNDIVILGERDIHSTECLNDEECKILVVQFLPGIINTNYSNMFESKYILSFLNCKKPRNFHIHDTFENSRALYQLVMSIYDEFDKKRPGYEIFIKGCIYQLIAHLIRNGFLDRYQPVEQEKELMRLDPLLQYIEKHYAEHIDLEKAANVVNLSYYYFSRYFKKTTGRNFSEYIDYVRVCEAERLLVSMDISISQVAFEVGFSNVCSFNKVYKRIRSYSPKTVKRAKTAKK